MKKKALARIVQRGGFSLIELLIIISLSTIIMVGAIPVYSNLYGDTQLNDNESRIVQTLRQAREQSFVRYNNANHGVKFLGTNYVLYQGGSYASRTPAYDITYPLDSSLSVATTFTNNDVNFSAGWGDPGAAGSIILTQSAYGAKTISIDSIGAGNFQ